MSTKATQQKVAFRSAMLQPQVTTDAMNRGSNTSVHVLLNLLNELRKRIKCEVCRAIYRIFSQRV